MRYYCNICKKDITKDEFLYSIDRFDKPLCREHQKTFRPMTPEKLLQSSEEKQVEQIEEQKQEKPQVISEETSTVTSTFGGFLKKAVVATGKGIVKGVKILKDGTTKRLQISRWKEQILRRMDYGLLKRLCREKNIAIETTRTELEVDEKSDIGFKYKDYHHTYSFDELVGRIKLYVKLDDIISFAKRNQINIRDIIQDIDTKKSEWQLKKLTEEDEDQAQTLLTEIQKAIHEYTPQRKYYQEILYQDTLASHLIAKLPGRDVKLERQRGSSRPDIVVDNIAIEIKGPTDQRALDTVPSKCMRYKMHFPGGLIVVLFDVQATDYYYDEWLKGIKRTHPEIIVIRK